MWRRFRVTAPDRLSMYIQRQYVYDVHLIRHEETIRLISAREATRDERRQYENP
jgi:uncharacterized DUF497 family protein